MSQFPGPATNQPISSEWTSTCGATPLASTTAVAIKAAAGAGLRNYLVGLQLDAHSGNSVIQILDDSTTVLFTITVGASGGSSAAAAGFYYFPTPIRSSANTALSIKSSDATTSVYWNAQGYVAP